MNETRADLIAAKGEWVRTGKGRSWHRPTCHQVLNGTAPSERYEGVDVLPPDAKMCSQCPDPDAARARGVTVRMSEEEFRRLLKAANHHDLSPERTLHTVMVRWFDAQGW